MEANSVLNEFRKSRKLLEKLRENMATPRLKGMWNFLNSKAEIVSIIYNVPTIENLVTKAGPNKPIEAATYDEIVGVGLYIMRKCSESNDHVNLIINHLGLGLKSTQKNENQIYVNELMEGFIDPALDFIEEKLEGLTRVEEGKNTKEDESGKEWEGSTRDKVKTRITEEEVLAKIKRAGSMKRSILDLSSCGLTQVPEEVWALEDLEVLDLRLNKLTSLPKDLRRLSELTELNVRSNMLKNIPSEIGQLTKLTKLYLHNNRINNLPKEIGELTKLRELILGYNNLTSIPPELCKLRNLDVLDLGANEGLISPPREVVKKGKEAVLEYLKEKLKQREVGKEREPKDQVDENKDWLEQEVVILEERDTLKFSIGTKSIMKVAIQLAVKEGENDWKLTTREILIAIAYSGKRKEREYNTAEFVLGILRIQRSDYLEDYFNRIDREKSIDKKIKGKVLKRTGYVGDALREAKKFAIITTGKNLIKIRHLIASLILFRAAGKETPGAHNVIKEVGIELPKFIREFQQYVTNTFKEDKTEEWRKIFGELQQETEEIEITKYGKGHIATIQMDRISEVDLLGRDRLVGAFAGMFVHTEEVEGFTVALLGDWGEGKSTMMKLIRKSLNEKHPGRFEFATFNAWEYERTDNIAAGLAQEVVNGLIEPLQQKFWERQTLRFKFAIKEYKGELCRLAIYSIVAILIIFISHVFFENDTLKGLGLAGGIAAVLFLLFKYLPTIIEHPIAIKLETYLKLPNYGKHLGDIPIIQNHLKTLCSLRLINNKKLIVFVDDLDRCQTDCIAGALDAIRLLMSIPNVIVMIGIDYRIAFKAMENYYEKLGDKERDKSEIARDYLGKIIQLPVQLMHSSPEEVRKYIEKRLFPDAQIIEDIEKDGDIDTEEGVIEPTKPIEEIIEAEGEEVGVRIPDDKKEEEPKSVEEILKDTTIERDMFSNLAQRFNFTNPRQLLRLRNSYRFLKVMDSDEKYDREILMKILFWKEFLNNWPSNIKYQCEKSVTKQESLEKIEKPEAKQIVQDVQEDISKIIEMDFYEEIERFVNIVVLPHSEGRILDTR